MANLTFYGAVNGVTGSAYLLKSDVCSVLMECGLIQGSWEEEKNNKVAFPFDVHKIDAVVLSHAHLDHSGRLPRLVADGYTGPIYMTRPTLELLEIMLKDAAFLQERDAEWENKRRLRSGKEPIEPLYTLADVEAALSLCEGIPYNTQRQVAEGVKVSFRDAGHILGSSIVELEVQEQNKSKKLVFSGDLGNSYAALLDEPDIVKEADVLLLESTYGDRDHNPLDDTLEEFAHILNEAHENGGNVLIPAFAVGRTQEIIFRLGELYQQGQLKQQAVFLDSPMAIATTEVYHRFQQVFNEEDKTTLKRSRSGSLHQFLPSLRYSRTTEESMAINRIGSGSIVIAGSGMCTGGRIRHHLKHNLWRGKAHVIIVGFQARGTPGRALMDGTEMLRLAGEDIAVKASIHVLDGFSAHASQTQLLDWSSNFTKPKPRLYLVHGESDAKIALQGKFGERGWQAETPKYGETISI